MSKKAKLILGLVLTVAMIVGLVFFVKAGIAREEERIRIAQEEEAARIAFQEGMAMAVKASPEGITGNKAVAIFYEDNNDAEGEFTSDYVPDAYKTDDPAQVRFVISRREGSELVGYYNGGGGSAHRHMYTLEVQDLLLGSAMQEVFYGGQPPMTITVKEGESRAHYGSTPNEEAITEWLLATLEQMQNPVEATQETLPPETVPQETEDPAAAATSSDSLGEVLERANTLLGRDYGFSPESLKDWLMEVDNYSEEEADYALENCTADWNQECLEAAIDCLEWEYGTCRSDLLNYLSVTEGFTGEQVQYAMANCNADWNEQAAKIAAFMVEYGMGARREYVIRDLVELYNFTQEEAEYGADNCGKDWG